MTDTAPGPASEPDISSIEDAAWKRMAPIISHEIRNPLSTIRNSNYFIKSKLGSLGPMDPKIDKHLAIIEFEVQRASDTLGEILAFARMDELALEKRKLIDVAEMALSGLAVPETIKIQRDYPPDSPHVRVDPNLLCAAMRHILRNSIEAMAQSNAPILRISIGTEEGRFALLQISDTGPGIAPEILPNLFVPFFTTKPRGIGLGLAFARKVFVRHGGDIHFVPGQGATFSLRLPLDLNA